MIRIGHIQYANCTPIFSALQSGFDCNSYEFISGVPAKLNHMLIDRKIDLCPASSITYAKHPEKFLLLPNISISAVGAVKSVLLFSRLPLAKLDNHPIALTTESETSVNLIKIILRKKYGFTNSFQPCSLSTQEALKSFAAILLIGDAALKENLRDTGFFVYDLGELWLEFTGLPFVFALWLVGRSAVTLNSIEVRQLAERLVIAKESAYQAYRQIAGTCAERAWLGEEALVDYWRTISYDLTDRHVHGVNMFFKLAAEMGLLEKAPELEFLES